MPNHKNKIFITIILCGGIITSIWLILQIPSTKSKDKNTVSSVSVYNYANTEESTSTDWQKILGKIDPTSQSYTDLTNKGTTDSGETTLTAQIARDFFSQYLLLKQGGKPITEDDINRIIDNTLSRSEYTAGTGAVYITSDLHVSLRKDTATVQKYLDNLHQMLKNRTINDNNDDPMAITSQAMKNNNAKGLLKLDPIIAKGKGVISDLVAMEVPADAVNLHLSLLNASSDLLSNLEGMRASFTDPLKSFVAIHRYTKHMLDFTNAVNSTNDYFHQKLGS